MLMNIVRKAGWTVRSTMAIVIGTLTLISAADAEMLRVSEFGFAGRNTSGQFQTFDVPAGLSLPFTEVKTFHSLHPDWRQIELYCTSDPGARFMQIDGKFYTLNGKSRRPGAFVVTNEGPKSVEDSTEASAFNEGDYDHKSISTLLQRAADACP